MTSSYFSPEGEMIAQRFDCTTDFLRERNNRAYFRLKAIRCAIKDQVRARHSGEEMRAKIQPQTGHVHTASVGVAYDRHAAYS